MTFLVERLAELRRYLDHARSLAATVHQPEALDDLTVRNDVLFSLLMIAQLVIDIAGELAARRGERFETYRDAIRSLRHDPRFPGELVPQIESLAGFRNVVVHEYVGIDSRRVIEALQKLEPVEQFVRAIAAIEREA